MSTNGAGKGWCLAEADPAVVAEVASSVGVSTVTARLLVNRGVNTPEDARAFLRPDAERLHDPFLMKDLPWAVETLVGALRAGRSITVYGDYDVDGITATVALLEFLRCLGGRASFFIPDRQKDGYGVGTASLEELRRAGSELIITVDCGMSGAAEVLRGRELGLDFIVTDHHPGTSPPAGVPVVNPQRDDSRYPCRDLSGAGVVFKLIQGVRASLLAAGGPLGERASAFDPRTVLDLVALGTIADVVPLTGENRILARLGLEQASLSRRPGLAALAEVSGISGQVNASAVAFQLAPRLNVSGRLGEAGRSVELLLERDPARARELARALDAQNRERQLLEAEIVREGMRQVEEAGLLPEGIVLAADHWHPGIIGIVASRMVDLYQRPTAILAGLGEQLKGSVRSMPGYSLTEILAGCADSLATWGGHRQAAGITLPRERLEDFRAAFSRLAGACRKATIHPAAVVVDLEIDYRDIRLSLVDEIETLEPFGAGNPPPVFLSRRVPLNGEPQLFGNQHARLRLGRNRLKAVGFRMASRTGDLLRDGLVDIIYTPQVDRWRGGREVTLLLKDLWPVYEIAHAGD